MRIGINVPNELHRRLGPLKEYINVSQICREAIEDRVRRYEKALASRSDPDVVRAVEQAWEEERKMRAIVEVDWGVLGCEDAKSWVLAARSEDWQYLHHRQDVIQRQERPRWQVPPPALRGVKTLRVRQSELYERMRQQDDQFFDWLSYEHGGIDIEGAEQEYMRSWLAYTDSAWTEKRNDYLERRRQEMLEADRNGPTPTVPEQPLHELGAVD